MSGPLRPAPTVDCGPVILAPVTTTGGAVLISRNRSDRPIGLTREQGTALRDALNAWLEPDGETPAPAASSPVPQADAGAVDPAAAPAPRTADPGFIPPESHVGESATVTMGQSSSICSACRRGCLPSDAVHDWCYGYGPQGPGCGATFTRVINPYIDVRGGAA